MEPRVFRDRREAGALLAERLSPYAGRDVLVLAIPRGGVVVGYEVAKTLGLPLDVLVIKKIGYPGNEEFALGAAGLDDYFLNEDVVRTVTPDYVQEQIKTKQQEVKRRYELLRGERTMYKVTGKTVIVIDDGIATGATMILAVQILRKQKPKKVVVAVPVAPPEAVERLSEVADEVVCLSRPELFGAIGNFYYDFTQVEDEEVKRLLEEVNSWQEQEKKRLSKKRKK